MAHVGEELRLVLARFSELAALVLDFPEQPDILDRDRGLVGKGLDERDLLIRKGPYALQVIYHHDAEQVVALQYGNSKHSSDRLGVFRPVGYFRRPPDNRNGDRSPLECGARRSAVSAGPDRVSRHPVLKFRRRVVGHCHPQQFAIKAEDECPVGPAEPDRAFGNGLEHGPQIKRRAADYLEHLGRGGLLLEGFAEIVRAPAQLVEQAGILDGDHGLAGEISEQRDLLVREETNFLTKDGNDSNELIVLDHWNDDYGPNATKFDGVDHRRMPFGIIF